MLDSECNVHRSLYHQTVRNVKRVPGVARSTCACAVCPPTMPCLAFFSREQVGRENLVGTENGALLCMMRNLEIERVTLAAMGLGIARCDWMDRHYDEGRGA